MSEPNAVMIQFCLCVYMVRVVAPTTTHLILYYPTLHAHAGLMVKILSSSQSHIVRVHGAHTGRTKWNIIKEAQHNKFKQSFIAVFALLVHIQHTPRAHTHTPVHGMRLSNSSNNMRVKSLRIFSPKRCSSIHTLTYMPYTAPSCEQRGENHIHFHFTREA